MASAAFKSTTKRSSIGDDSSNRPAATHHRRSRSLSRAPTTRPRSPPPVPNEQLPAAPRAKFVNTVRGSGFPEISLDHLATDLFPSLLKHDDDDDDTQAHRSRSASRRNTTTSASGSSSHNNRRGRSVSKHHGVGAATTSSKGVADNFTNNNNHRRRRSLSVAPYQYNSDSESDIDHSHKSSHPVNVKGSDRWNYQGRSLHNPVTSNHQRVLRRSLSQKDLLKSRDGYSSHSSALTDDEARDAHSNKNGIERTIRAVYAQKKTEHPTVDGGETELYEVMRKELRHAVEEIRTELEHGIVKMNHSVLANDDCLQSNKPEVLQAVSVIRDNYCAKLEQSEKRKHDLLAEIVVEEQRGRQLSKIVKELLPDPKNTTPLKNPSRSRKNKDRSWMSKCLTDDAEKYFDDFISNVEDTDISSFDGERSDASSSLGVKKQRDPIIRFGDTETCGPSSRSTSDPVEMDGVVLPWLQWETSNDGSPISCKSKAEVQLTPQNNLHDSSQGENTAHAGSNFFTSSRGSCSPGSNSPSLFSRDDLENRFGVRGMHHSQSAAKGPKVSYLDMDDYLHIQQSEEILFEGWRQRQRISSGALILCTRTCLEL